MKWMIEDEAFDQLVSNHRQNDKLRGSRGEIDFIPICKLFTASGAGTWLLTEADEDGLAFGLCDLGFGTPELGYVSLDELAGVRGFGGLGVEQDTSFETVLRLSKWAEQAGRDGAIRA